MNSISAWDRSLSILRTTDVNSFDSTDVDPEMLEEIAEDVVSPSSDSVSGNGETNHPLTNKRRNSNCRKRRLSHILAKQAVQRRQWREKRLSAFSKCRKISVGHSEAFRKSGKLTNATFSIKESTRTLSQFDESELEKQEINAFHAEIENRFEFFDEFDGELELNTSFEKLCHAKESNHPYEERGKNATVEISASNQNSIESDSQNFSASKSKDCNANDTPVSQKSMCSTRSNKTDCHCSALNLNRHKVPRIVKYKSQTQINQNLENASENIISLLLRLPKSIQLYLVSVTVGLLGLMICFLR